MSTETPGELGRPSHQPQERAAGLPHLPGLLPSHTGVGLPDARAHLNCFQMDHMDQAGIQLSRLERGRLGVGHGWRGRAEGWGLGAGAGS